MSLEQSASSITPEQCAADLMEAIHPIMQFIRTEMRSERDPSLSVPQFRVLAFLSVHPDVSLSEVADHLGVTRATASALVDRLVKRGLVDRAEHPQERRHVMLRLTTIGNDQLQLMREITRSKIAKILADFSAEELAQMSSILCRLEQIFIAASL
ncbi:MAG: MarR family transcriptional regulator [Scytolyngbya sp. HA4215-MV1]|jgi:DNA-binding MarR family transcriptional regulator|nr:MarR family transcriptional regulator [Scytolyngbya sp. HA4215-MV1]